MNTYTTTKTTTTNALRTWKVQIIANGKTQGFDVMATSKAGVMSFLRQNGVTGTVLNII